MEIRFDFVGDKIDLLLFKKLILKYFKIKKDITFNIYTKKYRTTINIVMYNQTLTYHVMISLYESIIINGDLIGYKSIDLFSDSRFNNINFISELHDVEFVYNSEKNLDFINKLINLIKLIYNLDKLTNFI